MILNIFSLNRNNKKLPFTESVLVVLILFILGISGYILLIDAIENSKKKVHLFNVNQFKKSMDYYLLNNSIDFQREDVYDSNSLYFYDITFDHLSLNKERLSYYSPNSFIRVIKLPNEKHTYQICLYPPNSKKGTVPIINTITEPYLLGENTIETMTPIDQLTTNDVILPN